MDNEGTVEHAVEDVNHKNSLQMLCRVYAVLLTSNSYLHFGKELERKGWEHTRAELKKCRGPLSFYSSHFKYLHLSSNGIKIIILIIIIIVIIKIIIIITDNKVSTKIEKNYFFWYSFLQNVACKSNCIAIVSSTRKWLPGYFWGSPTQWELCGRTCEFVM